MKNCLEFWKYIDASEYIIDVVENGYKLPFNSFPTSTHLKNNKSSLDNPDFVQSAISDLLNNHAVVESPHKPFVINPLTVAKNATKLRLVLDLRHINQHIALDKIKFEDWKTALQLLKKGDYLYSFDLKSGYHHISIHKDFHKYLGFSWSFNGINRFFYFTVLPFGLASAGHIFTKTIKCLVKYWRSQSINILVYLDDGLGISSSHESALETERNVRSDILKSGFIVNAKKSIWYPTQKLIWLGIQVDLERGVIAIPQPKLVALQSDIKSALTTKRITYRHLAQIVGKLISTSIVLGNIVNLKLRYSHYQIVNRSGWDGHFSLNSQVTEELTFWLNNVSLLNERSIDSSPVFQKLVYSDASSSGGAGFIVNLRGSECFRAWTAQEALMSSTWRELQAVYIVLKSVPHLLRGCNVKWFTDNQSVVSIVNKGSMRPHLQELALKIHNKCVSNGIHIYIDWIPRSLNDRADFLSRLVDVNDWRVSSQFFQFIDSIWGPHTVDRFANSKNAQLKRFNSLYWTPGSEGVDAFAQDWSNENNWLVPPIHLILRCLGFLRVSKAIATLIVPCWSSSVFWPVLTNSDGSFKDFVVDSRIFRNPLGIYEKGSVPSIFGDNFKASVAALRVRFA